jgi:protein-disulfide isomerase
MTLFSLGPGIGLGVRQAAADPQAELGALKDDIASIKADLAEIKKQLADIRQLLSQRPAQARRADNVVAKVSVADSPSMGQQDAPITLIEFSDYQCPFCQRFFQTTLPTLKAEYINTGKLRYVFRDFPLDSIHPQARKAAEAAHCAGEQGKYWEMHHLLFQNQRALQVEDFERYALKLNLDDAAFEACLEQGKYATKVEKNYADGSAVGITGTPGFFIGKTGANGTIEGTFIRGAQPIVAFRQVIDRLLEDGK